MVSIFLLLQSKSYPSTGIFCKYVQMFLQRGYLIKFSRQGVCCLSIFSSRTSLSKHRFYRLPEIYIVSLDTFTFQDQNLLNRLCLLLSARAQAPSFANNFLFLLLIRYLSKKSGNIFR